MIATYYGTLRLLGSYFGRTVWQIVQFGMLSERKYSRTQAISGL